MGFSTIVECPAGRTYPKSKGPVLPVKNVPRILLADDKSEILRTVCSLLEDEYKIVGMAENGERVLDLVRLESPDLVVLDIFMPILNGIETAIRLRESASVSKVLFLTAHEDVDFVDAAISVGALGYVLKTHLVTDLRPAIQEVLNGSLYVSPSIFSC